MIHTLTTHLACGGRALIDAARARHASPGRDTGVSTLEMVMLALGLMALAATLVTALTQAVTSRTGQIK